MAAEKDIIVALELATTSIRAIAGQRMPDGTMQVLAFAEENAASTQETSASMQELSSIVNDCSKDVDQIVTMSETLAENTNRFILR